MKHVNVVCAVIKNENNEYFCCRRGPGRALDGYLEFPGGKIEYLESNESALIREIKEELRSEIKVNSHITTVEHVYKTFSITLDAYLCSLVSGDLELSEHTEKIWSKASDLDINEFAPADIPIVNILKAESL